MTDEEREGWRMLLRRKAVQLPGSDCWCWNEKPHPTGYGHISVSGRSVRAHRLSYEVFNGPIPEGRIICHACNNRLCINPDHLYAGTHADNAHDRVMAQRAPAQTTRAQKRAVAAAHRDYVRKIEEVEQDIVPIPDVSH